MRNDGAFINETLIQYCTDHGIEFTRSRAYRSNDPGSVAAVLAPFCRYGLASGGETPPLATTARYSCSDWAIPLSARFAGGGCRWGKRPLWWTIPCLAGSDPAIKVPRSTRRGSCGQAVLRDPVRWSRLQTLGHVGHINWRHCESKPDDGLREPADVVSAGIRQVRFDRV